MSAAYSALPSAAPDSELDDLERAATRFPPEASPTSSTSDLSTHWHRSKLEQTRRRLRGLMVASLAGLVLLTVLGRGGGGSSAGSSGGDTAARLGAGLGADATGAGAVVDVVPLRPQIDVSSSMSSINPQVAKAPPTPTLDAAPSCTSTLPPLRTLNVNPTPRPPPPCASDSERYFSYEPHSGFHNQRIALVNALTLAQLLNRTLLLPPARVGLAADWNANLHSHILPFQEACKHNHTARLPMDAECTRTRKSDPGKWSYVGWGWIMADSFLEGRDVVDRWEDSQEWIERARSEGGLGIGADEIHVVEDGSRRSYQIYDSRDTVDHMGKRMGWGYRLDLDDLRAPTVAGKKLLQFGSLFGSTRLDLALPENKRLYADIAQSMIIEEDLLTEVSDEIKARLGTYIGTHLRLTERIFEEQAAKVVPQLFRQVAQGLLGLPRAHVDGLLAAPSRGKPPRGSRGTVVETDGQKDDRPGPSPGAASPRAAPDDSWWPLIASARHPLSPTLSCRGELHPPSSPLAPLNTPLFIATDVRSPHSNPLFAPFYAHFPCLFTLDDFAKPSALNHNAPVPGLVRMARGERKSDFDGLSLAPHLFGFLDAMVAAKGDAFVGTPKSTFSEYAERVLHPFYVGGWRKVQKSKAEEAAEGSAAEAPAAGRVHLQ